MPNCSIISRFLEKESPVGYCCSLYDSTCHQSHRSLCDLSAFGDPGQDGPLLLPVPLFTSQRCLGIFLGFIQDRFRSKKVHPSNGVHEHDFLGTWAKVKALSKSWCKRLINCALRDVTWYLVASLPASYKFYVPTRILTSISATSVGCYSFLLMVLVLSPLTLWRRGGRLCWTFSDEFWEPYSCLSLIGLCFDGQKSPPWWKITSRPVLSGNYQELWVELCSLIAWFVGGKSLWFVSWYYSISRTCSLQLSGKLNHPSTILTWLIFPCSCPLF